MMLVMKLPDAWPCLFSVDCSTPSSGEQSETPGQRPPPNMEQNWWDFSVDHNAWFCYQFRNEFLKKTQNLPGVWYGGGSLSSTQDLESQTKLLHRVATKGDPENKKKWQISNKFSIKVIRHCSLILTVFCNARFRPGWTIGFHSFYQRMTGQRARAKVLLTKASPSPSGSGGK